MIAGAPYPAGEVIARLKAKVVMLRLVGNAADLAAALKAQPATVPAAYVVCQESGDRPAGASGGVLIQQAKVAVQVVLFVTNFSRVEAGGGARAEMDALTRAADEALLNWAPVGGTYQPLWFTAGRDERYDKGQLVHQRVYSSGYRIQANPNP